MKRKERNFRYTLFTLGASEITANLYCDCLYLYWEGCVICSIYLSLYMERLVVLIPTCLGQSSVSWMSNSSQISQNSRGAGCRELTPLKKNSVESSDKNPKRRQWKGKKNLQFPLFRWVLRLKIWIQPIITANSGSVLGDFYIHMLRAVHGLKKISIKAVPLKWVRSGVYIL